MAALRIYANLPVCRYAGPAAGLSAGPAVSAAAAGEHTHRGGHPEVPRPGQQGGLLS